MFIEKGTDMLMLMSLLFGCNSKMDEATVKGVVEKAFMEQNPTEGRYGWEIIGKAQWFVGQGFNMECLMENEQYTSTMISLINRHLSGTTQYWPQKRCCIDMGADLSYKINSIEHVSEMGIWIFRWSISPLTQQYTPWVSCLNEDVLAYGASGKPDRTPSLNKDDLEKIAFQSVMVVRIRFLYR